MSRRGVWLVAGAGGLASVILWWWLVHGWGGGLATRAADDLGLLAFSGFASASCAWAAVRGHGRARAMWGALAAGLAAWSGGEVVWCYDELWRQLPQAPFPSWADAGFLLFPVGAVVALMVVPGHRYPQTRIRWVLDGVIVAGSLFVVSWVAVLGQVYQVGAGSGFALGVSLAYPFADLVLITMTVLTLVRVRVNAAGPLALSLLAAGMVSMSLSDSVFAYLTATNPYQTGNLIDLGWVVAFLLFGLSALSSTTARTDAGAPAAPGTGTPPTPTRIQLWLPYLPLTLAFLASLRTSLPQLQSGPVPGATVLVVLVLLVRQFVTTAENRRLLVAVAHQALHDPLTGLANRALFTDRLDRALQQQPRNGRVVSVICIDLDDFKQVNDRYGHFAGDQLLIRVAERLTGCLRAGDTLARIGGDEFAVVLDQATDAGHPTARRLLAAFTDPFLIDGPQLGIRVSLGVATAQADHPRVSASALVQQADHAMYTAKRRGGGIHPPAHLPPHPASHPEPSSPPQQAAGPAARPSPTGVPVNLSNLR